MADLWHTLTSAESFRTLIASGYGVLALIVFAETGLLVGFFLPGDSLLVMAGIVSAEPTAGVSVLLLNLVLIPAAIIGDAVGYGIGRRAGRSLFNRPNSRFFKQEHLQRTEAFYQKHGGKTIILARFVPIIRTFAPTVAGAAGMPYRTFALYNIAGGVLWVASTTLLGYFLGKSLGEEVITRYMHLVLGGVILLSIIPIIIEFVRARRKRNVPAEAGVGAGDTHSN